MPPRRKTGKSESKKMIQDDKNVQVKLNKDENVQFSELTEDQKLQKELNWCIDQLRIGLMTKKSTKQTQEAVRIIKILSSSTAPLVKKRQVMRQYFGDYRKKIADEEARWYKDSEKIRKNSTICSHTADSVGKSTYIRTSNQHSKMTLSDALERCAINNEKDKNNVSSAETSIEEIFSFNFEISDG